MLNSVHWVPPLSSSICIRLNCWHWRVTASVSAVYSVAESEQSVSVCKDQVDQYYQGGADRGTEWPRVILLSLTKTSLLSLCQRTQWRDTVHSSPVLHNLWPTWHREPPSFAVAERRLSGRQEAVSTQSVQLPDKKLTFLQPHTAAASEKGAIIVEIWGQFLWHS